MKKQGNLRRFFHAPASLFLSFTLVFGCICPLYGSEGRASSEKALHYLKRLSIEQLASLEVTTVSKEEEKFSDADAAISVITNEDIRRGGFTSIMEALRLVPGMQVAHIDANKWAISCRGFNSWYANKLLVLIDGRSVYTPLFSGVYWDMQDVMLEDIDRIEVIRGPGATLWGANAVNGVINIITKKARNTQGGIVTAGGGNQEKGFGATRYGGKIGKNAWYRIYAKYFDRGPFKTKRGKDAEDDWNAGRGGFRLDWNSTPSDTFTFQGDLYSGDSGNEHVFPDMVVSKTFADSTDFSGGNFLGRWRHTFSKTSEFTFLSYFDRTHRSQEIYSEARNTFDVDFHHTFLLTPDQQVVWGGGYRVSRDNVRGTRLAFFDPKRRTDEIFSAFAQDRITLIKKKLDLTVGSKFEHNDYSGFEVQPTVRLRWKPKENHTLWAAVSRAVRTPSRADHDLNAILSTTQKNHIKTIWLLKGNKRFDSEKLIAYEAGYRFVPASGYALDIATFYNVYHDLRTDEPMTPLPGRISPMGREINIPMKIVNKYHEDSYGFEISGALKLADWWKIGLGYSWIKLHLFADKVTNESVVELSEGATPRNQFSISSYMDLPGHFQLDTLLFYVDNLPGWGVRSYPRLDARIGWHPLENLMISVKFENLLDPRHYEYMSTEGIQATQVPRSVYGKITWRF